MKFSSQEYWSGLPCPPPGDLPNPGIKPTALTSPALAGRFFPTSATWKVHPLEWLLTKKAKKFANVGEDVEKRESSYTVGGKVTDVATVENSKKSPQKIMNGTII